MGVEREPDRCLGLPPRRSFEMGGEHSRRVGGEGLLEVPETSELGIERLAGPM